MTNVFHSKSRSVVMMIAAALIAIGSLGLSNVSAQVTPAGGAAANSASSSGVVGWRNDGTGHFPNATPPTEWYLKENGESKNILWKTKLAYYSWGSPIIIGDKVITRSDPYDMICLDKNTGKILWIRSHPPFVALSAEEKQANPALKAVEPLIADLQKLNDEFVAKGWSKELYTKKHDLQIKINELTTAADDKYAMPPDMYCESWSSYTGQTPCSDGQDIYFTSGAGVTGCYDLAGNLKWSHYEQFPKNNWGEHGSGASPAVFKDRVLVQIMGNLVVYDKKTGKELLRKGVGISGSWAAVLPFERNGNEYAIFSSSFVSLKDGKSYGGQEFANPSPVIDGDLAFFVLDTGRLAWHHIETTSDGGLKVTPLITADYNRLTIPLADEGKRWDPLTNYYVASPLYHQGLLYAVSCWGNVAVVDVDKTKLIYQKKMPFDFKNPPSRKSFGMGMGASPALAGKYIYMLDSANCMIVIEPGREYKQVAKNNIDYTVPEGWEVKHWMGAHHEQTEASPIFDGSRIYIRGEQFLYCVGAK